MQTRIIRMHSFGLILSTTLTILCNAYIQEDPIVDTTSGLVKGKQAQSLSGRIFYSFRGIPYAKPPLGKLRFKPPEDIEKWSGILPAQEDAPRCIQKNYLFANPKVEGVEDCLYLNVYTPKLRHSSLLPVMASIHYGGFFMGSASSDYFGPEYIMNKDVVLVSFSYRLAVMGFLSTGDDVAPGNNGLKDQVMALKWIQNNIEFFGGNKHNVTILGQSAGGASVGHHMLSPLSKNLFHRAIASSGSALALWALPFSSKDHFTLTKYQAQFVGCEASDNTSRLISCLQNVSAESLVDSSDNFKIFSVDPLNVYQPAIEIKTEKNPKPFMTKSPVEAIRNKEFAHVPLIVGSVTGEGLLRAEPILRQNATRKTLNMKFESLMPKLLALQLSMPSGKISDAWRKIKEFYLAGKSGVNISDYEHVTSFINLYTDRSFLYTTYQAALFLKYQGLENIWFYNLNYRGEFSYGDKFASTNETIDYPWGVCHSDDLLYLFKSPALFPNLTSCNDNIMINYMVTLYTNFAIYGNPTPNNKPLYWKKMESYRYKPFSKQIHYLYIDGHYKDEIPPQLRMKYGFYKKRFQFWENLPLSENIQELGQIHTTL